MSSWLILKRTLNATPILAICMFILLIPLTPLLLARLLHPTMPIVLGDQDGVVYDAKALLADVLEMVEKQKTQRGISDDRREQHQAREGGGGAADRSAHSPKLSDTIFQPPSSRFSSRVFVTVSPKLFDSYAWMNVTELPEGLLRYEARKAMAT